ncbi:2,3-bisphosphoglycerate-dependent phosphoglycerate mutase [Candidatus Woesearchaeota archaeon]|nr:2,3-bisphosphoglycerate-dependent phosphoglycerate mutase [Candidatus Woesearchaeota archaeon]
MKLNIYLFRHGQTYYNKNHMFTGWKDSKLTPKGIADAKKIAKKLKNKKFDVAFQSHLSRSKDTLKQVLKYHPECKKIITDDRMIERCYGKLQGLHHFSIINKYGQKKFDLWHRSYDVPPPKGESIKMVEKRVLSFIKDLLKLMKKQKVSVAISAHGNSMRPFRRYFEKLTIKQMMKLENPWDDYFHYTIEVK